MTAAKISLFLLMGFGLTNCVASGLTDWPHITSAVATSPIIEAEVARILAGMTLPQKIGQMTQPEIKSVTPAEVSQYYIGSVLNGGSYWPNGNKLAPLADWVRLADQYYDASMATDMKTKVPLIWGTDAIHGHGNAYGATLFPHNIGLGAAHDPALIGQIGAVVGRQVRASGIQWVFGPTVAVASNPRWGRTYESFSEDAELVNAYAGVYVTGLQGSFADDGNVIATAKHFIGDGATDGGHDQGVATVTQSDMMNIHARGYYAALAAGVQTVMASFNSWHDAAASVNYGKLHGSKALLTGVLKQKMGFDGFVVSDWNGIAQVPGCTQSSCAQAINAGIDVVMVPDNWRAFIDNTIAQVQAGEIAMARIDDAVTRILRVKLRAGIFGNRPSHSRFAGKPEALQERLLARRAVRQSLVLLKNNGAALPLSRASKILVVGKSANSLQNQTGGWTLGWQGTGNPNSNFPHADTILDAVLEAAGHTNVVFSETAQGVDVRRFDAVIAVIGETPYAEGSGDIASSGTLQHSKRFPQDLRVLQAVAGKGKPVITVLLSGRVLYVNDLLNLSDSFVAAWLPGTEGKGVADVLFRQANGAIDHDFTGRLSFAWPNAACHAALNFAGPAAAPLFALGYGLNYQSRVIVAALDNSEAAGDCETTEQLSIFDQSDRPPYFLQVAAATDHWSARPVGDDLNASLRLPADKPDIQVSTTQINTQQDAKLVTWLGPAKFFALSTHAVDLRSHASHQGVLQFDMVVMQAPLGRVLLVLECGDGCRGEVDLTGALKKWPLQTSHRVRIALACFARTGADLRKVTSPFSVLTSQPFTAAFANIQIVSGSMLDEETLACPDVRVDFK